ncbi:hypothetical protein [Aureimonas ureilytica]|uniref:hypothetical protein n=1 Tax=Aureimonas ureilytica TaxID=401562 RepID=UPI000B166FA1
MTAAPVMLAAATGSGGLVLGLFGGGSTLAVAPLVYIVGIPSPMWRSEPARSQSPPARSATSCSIRKLAE